MIGSSVKALAVVAGLGLAGCATTTAAPAAAAEVALAAPDDADLWNLAPADAESIAEIDVVALAKSPWSKSLVTGGFAEERADRDREFGYDVFADVDRLLIAGVGTPGAPGSLTVARGRFDPQRVAAAFAASAPAARAVRWRESPMWESESESESESGGRAVALVTPRTLVQGTPAAVRGAIDTAWRVVPDARGGALGEVRRALDADRSVPAVTVALAVTDDVRARAAGFVEVPAGLRRLGARMDLARDLDVEVRAFLDDAAAADAAADTWRAALRDLARQRMLRILGLGPLVDGASVKAVGSRVHGRLHVGEENREALGERLLFLLQTIARERRAQPR